MNNWIPYNQIDWTNIKLLQFHIDTRDFCCNASTEPVPGIDLYKTRKFTANYFHTVDEILALLKRYHEESGGTVEWRMFSLDGQAKYRTSNWQLKYIRIFRLPQGLVVYDDKDKFLFSKDMLACSVNQEYLNAH